jgi:hypothetical protein
MDGKEIILIPYWVENVLTRNKLNLDTVLNYSELSKVLSTNDIAQMVTLENYEQNVLMLGLTNNRLMQCWGVNSAQGSQSMELDFIIKLASDNDVIKDLINRLSISTDFDTMCPEDQVGIINDNNVVDGTFFKFVDINKDISAIIAKEDFISTINKKQTNALDLIRVVLKNLHTYYSVAEVARFKIFDQYVKLLNIQI